MERVQVEALEEGAKFKVTQRSYDRPKERYAALLDGEVDVLFEQPGDVRKHLESGEMKAILTILGTRPELFSDTPSLADVGLEDTPTLPRVRGFWVQGTVPEQRQALLARACEVAFATAGYQAFNHSKYMHLARSFYGREDAIELAITAPYAIGTREVTFAEWERCVESGGCGGYQPCDERWGRAAQPVVNVDWDDAMRYTQWLSAETGARYRLPTADEWEYAARAGTTTPFHTGETITASDAAYDARYKYAKGTRGEAPGRAVPAGSYSPNDFGLHDVHGNVREWIDDCYETLAGDAVCNARVQRAGAWYNPPWDIRSAKRVRTAPGHASRYTGFRIAREID